MPGVNYIPLPKIGEGLGEWLKPLLMKKGLGLMEDCRGTLHKSRPSLGTLNLRAKAEFLLGVSLSSPWNKDVCTKQPSYFSMSTSEIGLYFPFFISNITVPDSNACTVCHWPAGILRATTGPLGDNSIRSVQVRSKSS